MGYNKFIFNFVLTNKNILLISLLIFILNIIIGTEEQKHEFLKPCASGEKLGCFMLSEPGNGSDSSAASTTATKEGDHYILNGSKAWITNAHDADYGIVIATTDKSLKHKGLSAFIVKMKASGVSIGKKEDKLGILASSIFNIIKILYIQ